MLAASSSGTNVPPDDLKAAPVPALASVAAKQLRMHDAIDGLKANPGQMLEHDTAAEECRRTPLLIFAANEQVTTGKYPYLRAIEVSSPQSIELIATDKAPGESTCAA